MQHLCYQNSGGAEIHTDFIYMECKYTCGYIWNMSLFIFYMWTAHPSKVTAPVNNESSVSRYYANKHQLNGDISCCTLSASND